MAEENANYLYRDINPQFTVFLKIELILYNFKTQGNKPPEGRVIRNKKEKKRIIYLNILNLENIRFRM